MAKTPKAETVWTDHLTIVEMTNEWKERAKKSKAVKEVENVPNHMVAFEEVKGRGKNRTVTTMRFYMSIREARKGPGKTVRFWAKEYVNGVRVRNYSTVGQLPLKPIS